MAHQYRDLHEMIRLDGRINQYFSSLPVYVQESICERAGKIHNAETLRRYADNLLSGDK